MNNRIPVFCLFLKLWLLFALTCCYKNHLYVQQGRVDENYLASTHIPGAPDPRREGLLQGQRLLLSWDFPKSLFVKELALHITVRFWNHTEKMIIQPIDRKRSYVDFFFSSQSTEDRILTYRIEVISKEGELIETWKHQFWTKLIEIGEQGTRN